MSNPNAEALALMRNTDAKRLLCKFARHGLVQMLSTSGVWETLAEVGQSDVFPGIAYRIDPDCQVRVEPEVLFRSLVYSALSDKPSYALCTGQPYCLSDTAAIPSFRGYEYSDGTVRQVLDRTFGLPVAVLFARNPD